MIPCESQKTTSPMDISTLIDRDTVPSPPTLHTLPDMPENIWLDIFSYLTLDEKFKLARTCRSWQRILADPSLYTHIVLDQMEFNTLVQSMHHLCRLAPRIRSLSISNCFSSFISKTTVPVQNTAISHHFPQQPGMHSLYSHITSFTLPRRREEYRKLGFTLHQDFSRALVRLMEQSQHSLKTLRIHDNFLDLEMTELIFSLVRYGRNLEHLLYDRNKDGGFVAPEVVSAITAACPNIRTFQGHHAISDTVLRRMMTGWEHLRSVTLAPYQSPTQGTKEVSIEGLWSLLECGKVETLELLDLACISNDSVRDMMYRVKHLQSMSMPTSPSSPGYSSFSFSSGYFSAANAHPLAHHAGRFPSLTDSTAASSPFMTEAKPLPGASVKHLTLTKFTSTPLTLPGFAAMLKLFPNLETLSFKTNFFTYDHQFQGLTKDIYEQEIVLVERMIRAEMTERWGVGRCEVGGAWQGQWHAPLTEEQRLRAGVMRTSF